MSNRISEAFAKGKAFIPFITCGDPSLEITEQLVYAMEEAGADLIELGIPFSDPTAEGPVIQMCIRDRCRRCRLDGTRRKRNCSKNSGVDEEI